MNVVFSFKTIVAYMVLIVFIGIPRLLQWFGLDDPALTEMVSPWATFIFMLIAIIIFALNYLKNRNLFMFLVPALIAVAVIATMYICGMDFPF